MLIDWFTVVAQALNFLVLLWLMKRFLYAPILRAIDAREQRIAAELQDAEVKQAQANSQRDEFERKNAAFDQQRAELLSQATDEVKSQAQSMLDEARKTADTWSARRQDALRTQADGLSRAIEDSARNEVFAITRKALQDLATADLETSMAGILMQRLRALDGQAKTDFAAALQGTSAPATVSSAFAVPKPLRSAIQEQLRELFSIDTPLRFEIRSELVCGIELSANGQVVAWNVDEYLQALKNEIDRIAEERGMQSDGAASEPTTSGGPPEQGTNANNADDDEVPSPDRVIPAQVSEA